MNVHIVRGDKMKRRLAIPILVSKSKISVNGFFTKDSDENQADTGLYYDDFGDEKVVEACVMIEIDVDDLLKKYEIQGKVNLNRDWQSSDDDLEEEVDVFQSLKDAEEKMEKYCDELFQKWRTAEGGTGIRTLQLCREKGFELGLSSEQIYGYEQKLVRRINSGGAL